jgi:alpha-ketoglutarate-dependent taurine dioxygenase
MVPPSPIRCLPYGTAHGEIGEALDHESLIIIKGFPLERAAETLLQFADRFGIPSRHGIGPESNAELEYIHRIEALAMPRRDWNGNVVASATDEAMDWHTDDYYSERPVDTLLLLCCQKAAGGHSLLSRVEDILSLLGRDDRDVLRQPLFPTPFGVTSVLEGEGENTWVRYGLELEGIRRCEASIPAHASASLRRFKAAVDRAAHMLLLEPGDCLIIDNHRALHGRTEFNGARLLRRVRLDRRSRGGDV